eukprot:TRINITY_DN5394_c2_g1_i1.p1 TRINITY_DN5394_c2_g1~~TRINITY_DN5394_c2_g1_i1.p1  ORF type:complete len:642 (-),score=90.72 TRINITY_DN5394_c2_g1_i1:408-2333(-)
MSFENFKFLVLVAAVSLWELLGVRYEGQDSVDRVRKTRFDGTEHKSAGDTAWSNFGQKVKDIIRERMKQFDGPCPIYPNSTLDEKAKLKSLRQKFDENVYTYFWEADAGSYYPRWLMEEVDYDFRGKRFVEEDPLGQIYCEKFNEYCKPPYLRWVMKINWSGLRNTAFQFGGVHEGILYRRWTHGSNALFTFGDLVFLSGDFIVGDKGVVHGSKGWATPRGDELIQKDPEEVADKLGVVGPVGYLAEHGKSWLTIVDWVHQKSLLGSAYKSDADFIKRQALFQWYSARSAKEAMTSAKGTYSDLAFNNYNHFGVLAEREYMNAHKLAVQKAFLAGREFHENAGSVSLRHAYSIEALGQHYLTDLFAAGHVRVPRWQLKYICGDDKVEGLTGNSPSTETKLPGGVPTAGFLSKMHHDEDGAIGVALEIGDEVWWAFGDGTYFFPFSKKNQDNMLEQMENAMTSVLQAYVDGIYAESGVKKNRHGLPLDEKNPEYLRFVAETVKLPKVARKGPKGEAQWPPLFKVVKAGTKGKELGLMIRTTKYDSAPEYTYIDKTCDGYAECISCKDAIRIAVLHKQYAKKKQPHTKNAGYSYVHAPEGITKGLEPDMAKAVDIAWSLGTDPLDQSREFEMAVSALGEYVQH